MSNQIALSDGWLDMLQASGCRLTGPRRAIAEIMASSTRALGPLDVFDMGRKEYPGLGLVTVYRTLEKLEELGLIQRVHLLSGGRRFAQFAANCTNRMYLRAASGHEHLLLCTVCGQAEYFSGDDLDGLMQSIASRSGFEIRGHWLQFFGLCQQCRSL